ncbi:MAG: hypothetical protein KJO96_10245 [Winogradskyella sp.]|nr:hypothetical protein [Winogradskyella sp.]
MVLVLSVVITYACYLFNVRFNIDLTLLSIAIIFPLVFSIRGSFRRRENAMEHLSEFKSTLHTVEHYLLSKPELVDLFATEVRAILNDINTTVLDHLSQHDDDMKATDKAMSKMATFMQQHHDNIPRQVKDKVIRFMKDMHESVENLNAIHIHRTPISLKAYCLIFINIFPFIYTPTIIMNVGASQPIWIVYGIVILTQFILISLYNIQNQLEYPFDSIGIDDINLENFRLER